MRSGAQTLVLLATLPTAAILRAIEHEPKGQAELRREVGLPAQTTLRALLKQLAEDGIVAKRRRDSFPGTLAYELTDAGRELLFVAAALERWLGQAPDGPLELGDSAAKTAVKALAEGWSTAMLRALAAQPLTLTELDGLISSLNYPSLERRLSAMRVAGLLAAQESCGRGTPHAVTDWGRRGVGPLMAAVRWERQHEPAASAPVTKLDVETAFLLAATLLSPPADVSGSCRLAVELRNGSGQSLAGLLVSVRDGRLASRTTRLEGHPDAWVSGAPRTWLAALIERDRTGLELGGDSILARTLVDGLHAALFPLSVAG